MRTETEWSCSLAPNSGSKSAEFRDKTIYVFKEIQNLNYLHFILIYFVLHSLEITQKNIRKTFFN